MHLRYLDALGKPVFTCSAYRPFTKTKKECKKYSRSIYQNDLDKACFQHNMAYDHSVDLLRRTDI